MKTSFFVRLLIFTAFSLFVYVPSKAQPIITAQVGIPIGGTGVSYTAVMYGNGTYVSVMYPNIVYTSPDGVTWARSTGPDLPSGNIVGGVFGAGLFVVVGDNGYIASSPDGITWTPRSAGVTVRLTDVKFIQGAFFALTFESRVMVRSTDGINWSLVNFGVGNASDQLMNITYGNGLYVVAAKNLGGYLMYRSATGLDNSWTLATVPAAPSVNRVDFLKDKFYLFTSNSLLYTSSDALTWTDVTASITIHQPDGSTSVVGTPNQMFRGLYDGSRIYFYGYSGYYKSYGAVFSSADGLDFTLQTLSAPVTAQGVAYLNNKYIQYGGDGFTLSADGVEYKYPGTSNYGLAFDGATYVGVGYVGERGVISTSTDFSTWTQRPYPNQSKLYAVVYGNSQFLAVGKNTVISSADGNTWTEVATPADQFIAVEYGNGLFVAAGTDLSTQDGRLAYSSDGITWTTAYADRGYYFRVKYAGNRFFALGYDIDTYEGIVRYSADGINWTDATPVSPGPYVYYYNDAVYDGSKFHIIGTDDNGEFFSLSTTTPADPASYGNLGRLTSPPPGLQLGDWSGEVAFAYSNGHIAGMVIDANGTYGDAYVVYTTDGVNWSWRSANTISLPGGILADGSTFRVAGSNDAVFTFSFSSTLPVRLTRFNATLVNDDALLTWQTATEQNSDYFIVQHSTDQTAWSDIGKVKAAGQSNTPIDYRFVHARPQAGYHYYRLVQVDVNRQQDISLVKTIQVRNAAGVRLYPNPAHGSTVLQLPETGTSTINIFNSDGLQVYHRQHSGSLIRLNLQQLPQGTYQVTINQGNKRYVKTLSCQ